MKIRFYHWWVYSLYKRVWDPILTAHPSMVEAQIYYLQKWLAERDKQ